MSPATKKRKMEGHSPKTVKRKTLKTEADSNKIRALYDVLHKARSVCMSVHPQYCDTFVPKAVQNSLPKPLTEWYDPQNKSSNLDDLVEKGKDILGTYQLSEAEVGYFVLT